MGLIDKKEDNYIFPFDYNCKYEIVEQKMLQYLIDTRSANAIRIYIYLLNKYKWKKQKQEKYEFTIKEIKRAMGYSEATKTAEIIIKNVLESLRREGIIDYIQTYKEIIVQETIVTIPIYRLNYVAASRRELG